MPQEQGTGSETGFVGDDADNPGIQNIREAPLAIETQKRQDVGPDSSDEVLADISDSESIALVEISIDSDESRKVHVHQGSGDATNDTDAASLSDSDPTLEPNDAMVVATTDRFAIHPEDAATSAVRINVKRWVPP